jgi:hypothetical protein
MLVGHATATATAILAASLSAQVTIDFPGEVALYQTRYGEAVDVTLDSLTRVLGALQGRAVRVRGFLEPTAGTARVLRDGQHSVLLIPVVELQIPELSSLVGRRVEVVGVARRLIERQNRVPCHGVEAAPESFCDDPDLPPLPDREKHPLWPRNSVTFWGIIDATPGGPGGAPGSASALQALVDDPSGFHGQEVIVVGQFRGSNLFGDLPTATRLEADHWVVADRGAAVWVTGKRPRGDGWHLSLDDQGDTRWWIEVRGKVEVRAGVPYLKARELRLRPAPR